MGDLKLSADKLQKGINLYSPGSGHVAILYPGYITLGPEEFVKANMRIFHAGKYAPGESTLGSGFPGEKTNKVLFLY